MVLQTNTFRNNLPSVFQAKMKIYSKKLLPGMFDIAVNSIQCWTFFVPLLTTHFPLTFQCSKHSHILPCFTALLKTFTDKLPILGIFV